MFEVDNFFGDHNFAYSAPLTGTQLLQQRMHHPQ